MPFLMASYATLVAFRAARPNTRSQLFCSLRVGRPSSSGQARALRYCCGVIPVHRLNERNRVLGSG